MMSIGLAAPKHEIIVIVNEKYDKDKKKKYIYLKSKDLKYCTKIKIHKQKLVEFEQNQVKAYAIIFESKCTVEMKVSAKEI